MLSFGHRGFSQAYPENTILAIIKALEAGASGIETDIRITSDDEIILMHDNSVDRTTDGSGFVHELSYEKDIYNLRSSKNGKYSEKIPLLSDLLTLISTQPFLDSKIILDIKEDNPIYILTKLSKMLSQHELSSRLILGVWNLEYLLEANRLFSEYTIMLIHEHWPPTSTPVIEIPVDLLNSTLIDNFSIDWSVVKENPIEITNQVHAHGKTFFVWVLNSRDDIKAAKDAGCDAILTDDPTLF